MSAFSAVVTIPTAGRPYELGRTLASLAEVEFPSEVRDVYVVENGESSGAESVVEQFADRLRAQIAKAPNIRYFYHPVANKSSALNAVIADLSDEFVVFFDDDVRLSPDILRAYCQAFAEHGMRSYFGGPFGCDYDTPPEDWLVQYLPPSAVGWAPGPNEEALDGVHYLGFNWAASAKAIREAGMFDEMRGPGSPDSSTGQEYDMQSRLHHLGLIPCCVRNAMVWHYVPEHRCSQTWVLKRAYRNGVADGKRFNAKLGLHGRPRRWMITQTISLALKSKLSALSGNTESRFSRAFAYHMARGRLDGIYACRPKGT